MYKLLLVDDQRIILEGIEMMIRGLSVEFDQFVWANNGQKALELLESEKPDVILTDIRMPVMDGLTLCRHIRDRGDAFRNIPIILLTGYDEFEYARRGIEMQATYFLLKPVEREELFAALRTAQLQIEGKKNLPLESCNVNPEQIIWASQGRKDVQMLDEQLVLYQFLPKSVGGITVEEANQIKSIMGRSLRSLYARETEILCLTAWQGETDFPDPLLQHLEVNVSSVMNGSAGFRDAIHQLYIVHMKRGSIQSEKVLSFDDITRFGAATRMPPADAVRRINDAIAAYDTEALDKVLDGLEALIESRHIHEEQVMFWYSHICMSVYKQFYDFISLPNMVEEFNYLLYSEILLSKETSRQEMSRYMHERLGSFTVKLKDNTQISIVEKARVLLKKKPDMTQQELADELHIASPYLSKLFRLETGETFSDYSVRIRMDIAKEYLRTTDLSVVQIAELVGYSSEKYFYTIFRKMVGSSPAQYRKTHKH
ncbi:MAG: response regulator [Firmicutes bacterium]|nr:response regulator [Bacillota bacterium]